MYLTLSWTFIHFDIFHPFRELTHTNSNTRTLSPLFKAIKGILNHLQNSWIFLYGYNEWRWIHLNKSTSVAFQILKLELIKITFEAYLKWVMIFCRCKLYIIFVIIQRWWYFSVPSTWIFSKRCPTWIRVKSNSDEAVPPDHYNHTCLSNTRSRRVPYKYHRISFCYINIMGSRENP